MLFYLVLKCLGQHSRQASILNKYGGFDQIPHLGCNGEQERCFSESTKIKILVKLTHVLQNFMLVMNTYLTTLGLDFFFFIVHICTDVVHTHTEYMLYRVRQAHTYTEYRV